MQPVKKIAVCGAGTMGGGIAQTTAMHGVETVVYDLSEAALDNCRAGIIAQLQKLVEKGKITAAEKATIHNNLSYTTDIGLCQAELVIEAVVENIHVKAALFNQLAEVNNTGVVLATNTSSLSVTKIAAATSYAAQVVGMHFFNPAPLMKLVEVVRGRQTSEAVVQTISSFAKQLGKLPVICNDSPGFIVNRVARPYYLEALKMLEEGVADIATIDAAMENAGFKMGPFKLMDLIGIDVNYTVSDCIWQQLDKPERLQPSALQQDKVAKGELGKKTGKGFYEY
ncbi:3-hydroxyacyl-CoA dehydrogenase family protein [Foetidibacter luteolus]|uniref:3-hydroxyacyl-CoA dehydrogenase family protein n=1 Tax=Foetidibacter luteolus TaxID=2608880 RepID=UPI00129A50F5|nr:3-hydroxyacyl-CoA dehydrogenase NAD-binding domain-containing protein [Foetidibacter luteolus]